MINELVWREIGAQRSSHLSISVRRHSLSTQISLSTREIQSHNTPIFSLDIDNSDQKFLLAGSSEGKITVTELDVISNQKTVLKPIINLHKAHQYAISSVQWYNRDTGMFISAGMDGFIHIWDTNCLKIACKFNMGGKIYRALMSPMAVNNSLIACASTDKLMRLVDLNSGACTHALTGHQNTICNVAWSYVSQYQLATASVDKTIRLWDVRRSNCLRVFDLHNSNTSLSTKNSKTDLFVSHDGIVNGIHFTPDGNFLLSSGTDNRLKLWDIVSGKNTLVNFSDTKNTANQRALQFAVSKDGNFVYHPNGHTIGVYEVQTGRLLNVLQGHIGNVNCIVFHPKDEELYSAGTENVILMWSGWEKEVEETMKDEDKWSDDEKDL